MSKLREEYPDRTVLAWSLYPSKESNSVLEPYNAVLSTSTLIKGADLVCAADNAALNDICYKALKI